jgi:cold shock CspA family protein
MSESPYPGTDRKTGTIARVFREYGFISTEEFPDQDVYFKISWLDESPAPANGEVVTFELLKTYGGNLQAHNIRRRKEVVPRDGSSISPRSRLPKSGHIFDWAYLGYLPNVLAQLKGLALDEWWEFKNEPRNLDQPHPILFNYLRRTFERLVLEQKVLVNTNGSLAAFNTGLVDDDLNLFMRSSAPIVILTREHVGF